MPLERPRRRKHALKLNARDNIRIAPPAKFALAARVELLKTRREHDRAYFEIDHLFGHGVIDGLLFTGSHALATFRAQRTVQTAFGFSLRVFFRKTQLDLPEVPLTLRDWEIPACSPRLFLDLVRLRQQLIGNRLDRIIETIRAHVPAVQIALDGLARSFTGSHGFND